MNKSKKNHLWLSSIIVIIMILWGLYDFFFTTKENFYTGVSGLISIATTATIIILFIVIILNMTIGVITKNISIIDSIKLISTTALFVLILGSVGNQIWVLRVQ